MNPYVPNTPFFYPQGYRNNALGINGLINIKRVIKIRIRGVCRNWSNIEPSDEKS